MAKRTVPVILNILVGNRDDHLRNRGILRALTGWTLAPAFDLNPEFDRLEHALCIDESNERQVGVLGAIGTALLEGSCELAVVDGPRDLLSRRVPALPALDAPQLVPEVDFPAHTVELSPLEDPTVMDPAALAAAQRTPGHLPVRPHIGDDADGVESEPRAEDVVDGEEQSE